jgi:hypothetical protein
VSAWRLGALVIDLRERLARAEAERDEWHAEAGRMAEACDKAEAGRIPVPESGRALADSLIAAYEADLRKRIAQEIDQAWAVANDAGDSHDYLGGLNAAARIARGQS